MDHSRKRYLTFGSIAQGPTIRSLCKCGRIMWWKLVLHDMWNKLIVRYRGLFAPTIYNALYCLRWMLMVMGYAIVFLALIEKWFAKWFFFFWTVLAQWFCSTFFVPKEWQFGGTTVLIQNFFFCSFGPKRMGKIAVLVVKNNAWD